MSDATGFMFLRVIWSGHRVKFPLMIPGSNMRELIVSPEPSHPFGRKGLAIASAWAQLEEEAMAGLLILDGDVAIDPYDYHLMFEAVQADPAAVHIAPARLWPASRGDIYGWSWAHCKNGNFTHLPTPDPDFFSFNFTYLPRRVVELSVRAGLKNWRFPHVDQMVSRTARQAGVPMNVVDACQPKHLHY